MNIKEQIVNYIPQNMQEEKDKQTILYAMNNMKDVFKRDNEYIHFTSSAFVLNPKKDKVLMIYHNIYNSWGWIGGHADGDEDLLNVALREVREETSVQNIKVLNNGDIIAIDTIPCAGHIKNGKYVSSHTHISVAYLFEVDEDEMIKIKPDENSAVAWQNISDMVKLSNEPHMRVIYEKIIAKLN